MSHRVLFALGAQVGLRQPDAMPVVEHARAKARPQLGKGGPMVSGKSPLVETDGWGGGGVVVVATTTAPAAPLGGGEKF